MNNAQVDHLVVMASSLDQAVAWSEATLGVTPGPGGEHPLMGTHNRLLKLQGTAFPNAYLELIAINSRAIKNQYTRASRWFDMNFSPLQAKIAAEGPKLIHFVARVPRVDVAVAALTALGIDRGPVIEASRSTPAGVLRWRITVREDGQRLFDGALPTLIEWDNVHPTQSMADSGIALESLSIQHPQAEQLGVAFESIGLASVPIDAGPARITARLATPKGPVELRS